MVVDRRRTTTYLSLGLLCLGALVATVAAATTEWLATVLYVVAALQLAPAAALAGRLYRLPNRLTFLVCGAAALFGISDVLIAMSETDSWVSRGATVMLLGGQAALAVAIAAVVRSRGRKELTTALGDSAILILGTWLVSWIFITRPLLDRNDPSANVFHVVSNSTYQAMSILILFLLAILLFSDLRKPAAGWFVCAALGLVLTGDTLYALRESGTISLSDRVGLPLYVLALFTVTAAVFHPTFRAFLSPSGGTAHRPMLTRLVVTTTSLVVPIVVLALTDPVSRADRIVRTTSAVVLAAAVVFRVVQAVQANSRAQAELMTTAQTDPLTGLPNRNLLLDHITEAINESWQTERRPTVLFIDLDRFKNINDSLGHAAGDAVLKTVSERLISAVRGRATVARISGDEFVVLDPDTRGSGEAMALADRIVQVFREPLPLRQGDVFVTCSIGVAATHPGSSITSDDLLRQADTAMYRAKDAGRNCVAMFDESMLARVSHRLAVETALYRALDRRELLLYHQPIIDTDLGDVIGFEALMRWQRSDGHIVSPAEFIPIAEDTGTIIPIGAWALLEALTQLRAWIDDGVCGSSATMSVNVSPRQLHDSNFLAIVNEALVRSRVPASQLWLEVTESVMISEPEQALSTLRRLRALGVRVAIDDFGTGYSSLSLLQRFPLQRIKIDRAFVNSVADDPSARSLVRTIIGMGRSLGLDMVAEGVETVRQLQTLSELGCTKAQGYLISHPIPAEAMRSTVSALERFGAWPGTGSTPPPPNLT